MDERDEMGSEAGSIRSGSSSPTVTPLFASVDAFMQHLEMHRTSAGMPGYEMQGRMKCVAGRLADVAEDFDINLPPLGIAEMMA